MNPLQGSKAQPLEIEEEDIPLRFLNEQGAKSALWVARQQAYWSTLRINSEELSRSREVAAAAAASKTVASKPEPVEASEPKPVAEYRPFVWSQRPPLNHWASMRLDAERPYPPPAAAAAAASSSAAAAAAASRPSSAAAAASTSKPVAASKPPEAAASNPSYRDFRRPSDQGLFLVGSSAPECQPRANIAYWTHARDTRQYVGFPKPAASSPPVAAAAAAAPVRPLGDKPKAERKPRAPRKRKAEEELVAPPCSGVDVDTSDPKDIGSSLQCGICLGLLYRPLVMKCKHSVCYVCYLDLVKHKGEDKIVCPMRCKPGRDLPPESLVLNDVIQTFLQHSGRFTPAQIAARKLEEAHWDKVITKGLKKQRHSRAAAPSVE